MNRYHACLISPRAWAVWDNEVGGYYRVNGRNVCYRRAHWAERLAERLNRKEQRS